MIYIIQALAQLAHSPHNHAQAERLDDINVKFSKSREAVASRGKQVETSILKKKPILRSSFIIVHPDLICTKMKTELNGIINKCFIITLLEKTSQRMNTEKLRMNTEKLLHSFSIMFFIRIIHKNQNIESPTRVSRPTLLHRTDK